MAGRVPARLSPGEGRRFGLTVGLAFGVLGLLIGWRWSGFVGAGVGLLGAALVGAGLMIPGRLGQVHRAWMGLALAISRVTTPVLMGLIFFGVITPMGLVRRLLGGNPLVRRPGGPGLASGGYWVERSGSRRSDLRRQY